MKSVTLLNTALNDVQRKSFFKIIKELIHCAIIEREIPYYYFTSSLYKRNSSDYRNFIGHKKINRITKEYFREGDRESLKNKVVFSEILESNSIETPKVLGYNNGTLIHFNGESEIVDGLQEFKRVLQNMIDHTSDKKIFVKPLDGVGGSNTFKFSDDEKMRSAPELLELLKAKKFVFQENIKQHQEINKINKTSINTLRIHTHYDFNSGKVEIISALMRFGVSGRIVDNGGIFIPVNTEEWVLKGKAMSFLQLGGEEYSRHPDTGFYFDGYQLPFKDEIKHIVEMSSKLFEKDFIGWDVAITDEGPSIIEGNDEPHLVMAQMASGGMRNHDGYKKIFSKYL